MLFLDGRFLTWLPSLQNSALSLESLCLELKKLFFIGLVCLLVILCGIGARGLDCCETTFFDAKEEDLVDVTTFSDLRSFLTGFGLPVRILYDLFSCLDTRTDGLPESTFPSEQRNNDSWLLVFILFMIFILICMCIICVLLAA